MYYSHNMTSVYGYFFNRQKTLGDKLKDMNNIYSDNEKLKEEREVEAFKKWCNNPLIIRSESKLIDSAKRGYSTVILDDEEFQKCKISYDVSHIPHYKKDNINVEHIYDGLYNNNNNKHYIRASW